jgi:hypothetical protein
MRLKMIVSRVIDRLDPEIEVDMTFEWFIRFIRMIVLDSF